MKNEKEDMYGGLGCMFFFVGLSLFIWVIGNI